MNHGDLFDSDVVEEYGYALTSMLKRIIEPERSFLEEDVMSAYIVKILYEQGPMGIIEMSERTVDTLCQEFPGSNLSPDELVVKKYFITRLGTLKDELHLVGRVDGNSKELSLTPAGKSIWEYYGQRVMEFHKMTDYRTFMK